MNATQTNAPALTNEYLNTKKQQKIQKRELWLKDKISQMGHDPKKYEAWHNELEQIQEKIKILKNPQEVVYDRIRSINLQKCTDNQLVSFKTKIDYEIKKRKKEKIEQEEIELQNRIKYLKQKGWLEQGKAFAEIRRIISEYHIFDDVSDSNLSNSKLKQMVKGSSYPWHVVGPMKAGLVYSNLEQSMFLLEPKQLLCHIINQIKSKHKIDEWKIEQEKAKAERIQARAERIEARAGKVAQTWYQKMQEQNAQFEIALADAKARKKMSITENAFEEMS